MNKLPNLPIQIVGRDNVSNLYDLLGSRPLVLALHRFFGCTLSVSYTHLTLPTILRV